MKIRPQAKIDNFAFKNSNTIIEGLFRKREDYFKEKNLQHRKIILLINFIFDPTFFHIAAYQILKNYAILINHEPFFHWKDFPQLYRFWFLKINSLMAETIKRTFSKTKFL